MDNQKIILFASDAKKEELKDSIKDVESEFTLLDGSQTKNFDLTNKILLLGGDGSLNYLINSLDSKVLSRLEVIYFPTGSANDFAKSLKITPNLPTAKKITSLLNNNKLITIPLGECNDRKFINVMCAGAAALVTESGDTLLKKVMGKVTYYIGAIEQLLSNTSYRFEYRTENQREKVESPGFVVSQGLFAGGGIKVTPSYSANFGATFDFLSLRSEKLGTVISSAIELQKENPKLEDLELDIIKTNQVEINSSSLIPAKLDGEEYSSKRFLIKKSPTSLMFHIH